VAFSSKVAQLPTVEGWEVAGGKLLQRWSRGTVELLLLLLWWLLLLELPRLELWAITPILLLYYISGQNSGGTDIDSDWPKLRKSQIPFQKATLSASRWSIK
jgi:hypothetical protein